MKLLVTGGAGFIGANFVLFWTEYHPTDHIVVLDKLTYAGDRRRLASVENKITFIEGDVCDAKIVRQAMEGCDIVVHFAAETHVDRSINDPYVFTRTNVLGTHTLLETARQLNIPRFHHVSTDEVFGDIPLDQKIKFNETTPFNPRSPYSASKAGSDHLVTAYHETYGLSVTITNCSNNFGPYMHPEKFIPRSIIRLLNGENIRIYTPGNQVRDWLFVEDHCRAIEAVLERGRIGQTYCIGGMTEEISNLEVAKQILSLLDLPENRIELVTDRPGHDVKYAIDWTKTRDELGWKPKHDFSKWLKFSVDWYKANQSWWQSLAEESEHFYQSKGEKVIST